MSTDFSSLERNILRAKGLSEEQLQHLRDLGVGSRADFQTVGSPHTLLELMPDLDPLAAARVMAWALPAAGEAGAPPNAPAVVVNTGDAVFCVHCGTKQPKDYTSGDLCPNCGLQAEPIQSCYWCGASGPGRYCRSCGATFVSTAELPLALVLRRDGLSKDDIPRRLQVLTVAEKDALWGRVRRARL